MLSFSVATADDAPAIAGLVQSAYRGDASRQGWTTEADLLDDTRIDADGVRAKIADASGVVLLAHEDAVLVACCEVVDRGAGTSYFGLFAVRPDLQAAGVGRAVLTEAERHAAAGGATTMEMTVLAPRVELIAWYERRGYARTGETRPFVYDVDGLEFVVLRKAL